MTTASVFAPAKINLTLHVTGRRTDGYHLLDSLVAFAPVGDHLELSDGNTLSLTVEGPEAQGVPADMDNLALRAADLVRLGRGTTITLTKNLPAASGIGGGSADAAASVRAALMLEDDAGSEILALGPEILVDTRLRPLLGLGADIPMCLLPAPLRARGIGEKITFHTLPPLPAVLVNPRRMVPTGAVFAALKGRDNPPMPETLPDFADADALIGWLATQRNDLEAPAIEVAPVIADVLSILSQTEGCQLARMSGSGATCFGLYPDEDQARAAAAWLGTAHPDWWVVGGVLGDMSGRAMPQIS